MSNRSSPVPKQSGDNGKSDATSLSEPWTRGTLIALCGIDGSGKTTLSGQLAASLTQRGHAVVETRQPTAFYRSARPVRDYHDRGSTPMGAEGLALLSAADRLLHVHTEVVLPLLTGAVVISDRYLHATLAIFQARGVDLDWLVAINRHCPPPHVTMLLDCPASIACERIRRRGGHIRLEERSTRRLERIRRCYLDIVPPDAIVLDATLPPEQLLELATAAVVPRIESSRTTSQRTRR